MSYTKDANTMQQNYELVARLKHYSEIIMALIFWTFQLTNSKVSHWVITQSYSLEFR